MKEIEAWVARDRNGKLYIYRDRPLKDDDVWFTDYESPLGINFMRLADESFPEVKWSDKEATKVKITIERCK